MRYRVYVHFDADRSLHKLAEFGHEPDLRRYLEQKAELLRRRSCYTFTLYFRDSKGQWHQYRADKSYIVSMAPPRHEKLVNIGQYGDTQSHAA